MGKGKLAAQVAHAAVSAAGRSPHKSAWLFQGQKKTVLKCSGLAELKTLRDEADKARLPYAFIEDAGLTQLPPGTATCLGIGPAPEDLVDEITGRLKLL